MAYSVCIFSFNHPLPQSPYLYPVFYLNFDQVLSPEYCLISLFFSLPAAATGFLPPKSNDAHLSLIFTQLYSIMHCVDNTTLSQLQAKKTDQVKAADASIKVLLENPTKETAALIQEAQVGYDGTYLDSYLGTAGFSVFSPLTRVHHRVLWL